MFQRILSQKEEAITVAAARTGVSKSNENVVILKLRMFESCSQRFKCNRSIWNGSSEEKIVVVWWWVRSKLLKLSAGIVNNYLDWEATLYSAILVSPDNIICIRRSKVIKKVCKWKLGSLGFRSLFTIYYL